MFGIEQMVRTACLEVENSNLTYALAKEKAMSASANSDLQRDIEVLKFENNKLKRKNKKLKKEK